MASVWLGRYLVSPGFGPNNCKLVTPQRPTPSQREPALTQVILSSSLSTFCFQVYEKSFHGEETDKMRFQLAHPKLRKKGWWC